MASPGQGRPPSLYSTKAHAFLASLLGTPNPAPPTSMGTGQDVGAGEDVGVGAAIAPSSGPAFVQGVSQNNLPQAGISAAEAAVMCGPAAALFMTRMGRTPTYDEAQRLRQMALDAGWSGRGMGGTGAFQTLARQLGLSVETGPADATRIANDATLGLPVVLSTPEHYWQVSDYNANTGKFLMGDAVGANREMTLEEVRNHPKYGGPLTAIYVTGASRAQDREPSTMARGASGGEMQLLSSRSAQPAPQAQSGAIDNSSPEAFIRSAYPMAQQVEAETGVPAALSVAVAANETAYGAGHGGGQQWNSYHSIRGSGSAGRTPAGFRANSTPYESFRDFGRLISGDPAYGGPAGYARALSRYQQDGNLPGLLQGIADAGYEVAGPERTRFVNQVNGHLNRVAGIQGLPTTPSGPSAAEDPLSALPEWLRGAVGGLVDRALGVSTAYAAEDAGPSPSFPYSSTAPPGTTRLSNAPATPAPAAPQATPQAITSYDVGTAARGAVGRVAQGVGTPARVSVPSLQGVADAVGGFVRGATGQPATTPAAPSYTGTPSTAAYPSPSRDDWRTNPGTTPQPAEPGAPVIPKSGFNNQPMRGQANSILPVPGMNHMPWVVYGPDEGDGMGTQIEDPKLIEEMRRSAQAHYENGLRQQIQHDENEANREVARMKLQETQTQFAQRRAELLHEREQRSEDRAASRDLEQQRITAQWGQLQARLEGPEGYQVMHALAPGGLIVDKEGATMIALDENGQPRQTWQIPGMPAKQEQIPGYGYYQQTTNPDTKQIEMRPIPGVPGPQTIVDRTVLQSGPRGYEAVSRVASDPEVERFTDRWGRSGMMNRRTGETVLLNEGAAIQEQRGRVTYNVPPPAMPRYIPPTFQPTTYGRPEVPWQGQQEQLPPGVVRTPDGNYVVPNHYLQPQQQPAMPPGPQFVQPQQDEEQPDPAYEMSGYSA